VVPEVAFSRRALASLRSYDDFLRPRNRTTADGLAAEVKRTCALLAAFPHSGKFDAQSGLRVHVTRKYRYRIVYGVTERGIEVRDVLHPAQR
jgi:plasmid stabilization system protein ParE